MSKPGNEILGVQSARNSMLASTLLASSVLVVAFEVIREFYLVVRRADHLDKEVSLGTYQMIGRDRRANWISPSSLFNVRDLPDRIILLLCPIHQGV